MKRIGLSLSLVLAACSGTPNYNLDAWDDVRRLVSADSACFAVEHVGPRDLYVAQLGASPTICADNVVRSRCPVARLDLSRIDLEPTDEAHVRERIVDGSAFVLAKLVADPRQLGGRLVINATFLRTGTAPALAHEHVPMDAPVVLHGTSETCGASSRRCAWLNAAPLDNSGAATRHEDFDVSFVGLTRAQAEERIVREGLVVHGRPVGSTFVVSAVYDVLPAQASVLAPK